jgi:hypothetical protein
MQFSKSKLELFNVLAEQPSPLDGQPDELAIQDEN